MKNPCGTSKANIIDLNIREEELKQKIKEVKRRFRNNRIQFKLTVQIFFIALVPLIISGLVTYKVSSDIIETGVKKNSIDLMEQAKSSIDSNLQDMEYVSNDILFNQNIIGNIKNHKRKYDAEDIAKSNEIKAELTKILATRKNLKAITILCRDGLTFSVPYGIMSEAAQKEYWYRMAVKKNGKSFFSAADSSPYNVQNIKKQNQGYDAITLSKVMKDVYTGEVIGVLCIEMYYKTFENLISKISPDAEGSIFLSDSEGKLLYRNKTNLYDDAILRRVLEPATRSDNSIDTININGQKLLFIFKASNLSGWNYTEVISYKKLMKSVTVLGDLTIALIIASILATFVTAIYVSNKIIKPLKYLGTEMNRVEKGELDVRVSMQDDDEIGQLGQNFNNMVAQLKEMKKSIYMEQEAKREAELSALQAQINPHFLYNTLDSIKWMAMVQGNDNITKMIGALVSLLRNTVNKGREIIPISQELENVKNFIAIQRLRYFNSFEFNYDVEESLLGYGIPKLVLQPIVENALFHGIENLEDGGVIQLNIRSCLNDIVCEVIDNGKGMTPEGISGIYSGKAKHKFTGISMKNVNERLKLHFGDQYVLQICSEKEKQTKVVLKLPLVVLEEESRKNA